MLHSGYALLERPWAELWGRRALVAFEWKLKELDIRYWLHWCQQHSQWQQMALESLQVGRGQSCDPAWLVGPYCQHLEWAASAWVSWASTIMALPLVNRAAAVPLIIGFWGRQHRLGEEEMEDERRPYPLSWNIHLIPPWLLRNVSREIEGDWVLACQLWAGDLVILNGYFPLCPLFSSTPLPPGLVCLGKHELINRN